MIRLFTFLLCLVSIDGKHFRNDYKFNPDVGGWLKLHRVPSNWNEARVRCHLEGSVLLSPLNDKLLREMKNISGQVAAHAVYTGISAMYSSGDFFSIEGVPLNRIPASWAPNEPNNLDDEEQCITMLSNGALADVNCNTTYPYICYKENIGNMPELQKCGTIDPEYSFDERTGHCYKFHRFAESWSRAFMTCAAEGGYLAIINSEDEAQVLRDLFAKYPVSAMRSRNINVVFIGFRAETQTNHWRTVHGQTLKEAGYEKWAPSEPGLAPNEFCGSIHRNALLNDIACDNNAGFICEKTPDSLLDNIKETTGEISNENKIHFS